MKPIVITITGPSASGKSTLKQMLVDKRLVNRAVSTTTRPMRSGETSGVDYYFVHQCDFDLLEKKGDFLESVKFGGHSYGVTRSEVITNALSKLPTVIVVEPNGVNQINKECRRLGWVHFSIFVTNDLQTLIERFLTRETVTKENVGLISKRLVSLARIEPTWERRFNWDVVVENFSSQTQQVVMDFLADHINDLIKTQRTAA